jgi:deoxyribose-phosphate aldolase
MTPADSRIVELSGSNHPSGIASRMQSTLISNTVTNEQWQQHIADCLQHQFHAAMVPPAWVKRTAEALRRSRVRVASFLDFPLGTMTSAGKAYEAGHLVGYGVQEIDLMPNVGFLISGMEKEYFDDIRGVVETAHGVPIKIMLELPLLDPRQRERAVTLSIDAGVAYLKNASSGAVGVAQPSDIRFLRSLAPAHIGIKASGGIKHADQIRTLLEAGADLIGTSAASQIMREASGETRESARESATY